MQSTAPGGGRLTESQVGTQAPRFAGFVCFKPADKGGEFWLAGGNDLFHELSTPLLEKMQRKKVIFSVVRADSVISGSC